ncbi:MAG: VCBS repeat-containing protein [Bdellovibrionales bacterium]|nr:VCBS repeat-containing protein [Bdellovibrionales bacterium]
MKSQITHYLCTLSLILTLGACGGKKDSGKKIISYPLEKLALTLPGGAKANLNINTDSIAKGDLNGDGKLELAVGTGSSINSVVIFHNLAPKNPAFDENKSTTLHTLAKVDEVHLRDINGDEKLDVIALESIFNGGKIEIFLNLTESSSTTLHFAQSILFVPDNSNMKLYYDLAMEDLDGDGDLDFVLPEYHSGNIEVYHQGNGVVFNSSADQLIALPINRNPQEVVLADFNGDGPLDLAVVDWYGGGLSIYTGDINQTGYFLPTVAWSDNLNFIEARELVAVDLNGDQKLDLAYTELRGGSFGVYKNTSSLGSVSFSFENSFSVPGAPVDGVKDLKFSDIDEDGNLDALIVHQKFGGGDSINIYLGNGDGSFQTPLSHYFYSEVDFGNIISLDVYDRGHQDLVYFLNRETLIVNLNDHTGQNIAGNFVKDDISLFSSFAQLTPSTAIERAPFDGGDFNISYINLANATFAKATGSILVQGIDYSWEGSYPTGLVSTVKVLDSTTASVTWSGNADHHTPSDNTSIKIVFTGSVIETDFGYDPNKALLEILFRSPIVMYSAGLTNANLGGAPGAVQTCSNQKPSGFAGFTVVAPLLSVFNITSMQYAAFFGLDDKKFVFNTEGDSFGTLAMMLDPNQNLYRSLVNGMIIDNQSTSKFWWSGWTNTGAPGSTASGWTSSSSGVQANVGGAQTKSGQGFLYDHTKAGNDQAHLLCVMSEPN